MTEEELRLWDRLAQHDETARRDLVLFYLPLVDTVAGRIARITGANRQDLRQEGVIGLIQAIARFDPSLGVPFTAFGRRYISGAIFDSSEVTRRMARPQEERYRRIRDITDEFTEKRRRIPTIDEVAEIAGLTVEQVGNAIDARAIAFAEPLSDAEKSSGSRRSENPRPDRSILVLEALAHLNEREQEIVGLYYFEDQSHEQIAQSLRLTGGNVSKIRQRALEKLRKHLDVKPRKK